MNGLQFMFVGISLFAMSRLNNLYPDWEESGRFSGADRNGSLAPYIDVFVYGGMRCAVLDSAFIGQ